MNCEKAADKCTPSNNKGTLTPIKKESPKHGGGSTHDGLPIVERVSGLITPRQGSQPAAVALAKDNKLRRVKICSGMKSSSRISSSKDDIKVTINNREVGKAAQSATSASADSSMEVVHSCSSSQDVHSPSVLPPINPCLNGTCPFADAFKSETNPVWLGCQVKQAGKRCNYWVHARCHGFPRMSMRVVKLAKGFRCPKHLK